MKNPKWHRDEIILTLDLYFRPDRGSIDARNPNIIALSQALNLLPIFMHKPDADRFRNPNGVSLKMSNFLAIDPQYLGRGMERYSRLDREVFNEFVNDRERLHTIAERIRAVLNDESMRQNLLKIKDDDIGRMEAMEGEVLYRLHKYRERDKALVAAKKKALLKITGALICEVCTFDYAQIYGKLGEGFIECHHTKPLAEYKIAESTNLEDLALVCANCHRMLHRCPDITTIEKLKKWIKN